MRAAALKLAWDITGASSGLTQASGIDRLRDWRSVAEGCQRHSRGDSNESGKECKAHCGAIVRSVPIPCVGLYAFRSLAMLIELSCFGCMDSWRVLVKGGGYKASAKR